MLVVDTDVLTIWQHESGVEYDRLRARFAASGDRVHVTIVSFEEQTRGWLDFAARIKTPEQYVAAARRLRELLTDFAIRSILDFDDRSAAEFHRLKAAKIRIGTMDLRIAAIVLANNATLITRNLSDFRKVPRLRAEDWTRL